MKKNLKKVISAVAALALSTSSFVALAQTFPDVADTADYAKAVDQLTSLGIVEGRTDGTFDPEGTVTRAEMTAMIIRALGEENAAKASAGQNTKFTDVDSNHWAAGYITQAMASEAAFIQGMGDGTFAPDANVTFAQAVTMLVRAVGYESQASQAVWPSGYMSYGSQLNITNGVAGQVGTNADLNRGYAAILIDNAVVDAPLMVKDTLEYNPLTNQPYWSTVQKNGTGKEWQTLLTNNLDGYKVYGTVTATKRTNSGLEADEINFNISRADNFEDEYITSRTYPAGLSLSKVNVGNTKAADSLNVYAEAIILVDDNDDYHLVSFNPTGRSDEITFAADDYAEDYREYGSNDNAFNKNIFYVYRENSSNTDYYRLADGQNGREYATWYINGVPVSRDFINSNFDTYVTNNYAGDITLTDTKSPSSASSTDGYYDSVMITYYADAVVSSISSNSTSPRVYFERSDRTLTRNGYLTVDLDDDEIDYKFLLNNEQEIAVTDLQPYDVLSIQWDVTKATVNESEFVNAIVARNNVVSGTVRYYDEEDGYSLDNSTYYELSSLVDENEIETGTDYTLYLDFFGNIAYLDEGDSSKNYAVLDHAFSEAGGTNVVRLITADGRKVTYDLRDQSNSVLTEIQNNIEYTTNENGQRVKKAPQDRVVEFTVRSSTQEVTIVDSVTDVANKPETQGVNALPYVVGGADLEYNATTNRIGGIRLSDTSAVLDLTRYESKDEYGLMTNLQDDGNYTAYGFARRNSDATYAFVIVTEGNAGVNADSPLTIFATQRDAVTDDNDDVVQLNVYSNGESAQLLVEDKSVISRAGGLTAGDAFLYELDNEGYVENIVKILALNSNYDTFTKNVFDIANASHNFNDKNIVLKYEKGSEDRPEDALGDDDKEAYFAFGPIIETAGSSVTLATLDNENKTDVNNSDMYTFDAETNLYVYDYSASGSSKASDRVDTGSTSSFIETYVDETAQPKNSDYIDWNIAGSEVKYNINYALLKIVQKDIAEGYAILPPQN